MVSGFGNLSGSGPQQVWLNVDYASKNDSTMKATFNYELRYYGNGYGSFGNSGAWSVGVPSGNDIATGTWSIGSGQAYDTYTVLKTGSFTRSYKSDGTMADFTARGAIDYNHSNIGAGEVVLTIDGDTIPDVGRVPDAPPAVVFVAATPTSLNYTGKSPSDTGSAPLERSEHQITLEGTGWSNPVAGKYYPYPSGVSSFSFGSLQAGKRYAVRMRYENAIGWGPWSPTVYGSTLPATAPGIAVTSSGSGTSAMVSLTPPSGVTGVDLYTVERRVKGQTTVVTLTTTTPTVSVPGLTPGATYEWRASATFGGYTSPYSAWLEKKQLNPNANTGDYFDGSTVPEPGSSVTYAWTGTAHGSASTASMPVPVGWLTFAQGNATSGGTGAVAQVSGAAELPEGLTAGQRGARVQFNSDATAAGFVSGGAGVDPGRAAVSGDALYYASMYVMIPARAQRMAVRIAWTDAAGASISTSTGDAQLVGAGAWTRLVMSATSPSNAAFASVRVVDMAGDGWALWRGGDTYLMDAAMLTVASPYSYFDGSFAATDDYTYAWQGTAHASPSIRGLNTTPPPDPLADPDCVVVPGPPRPPVVLDECIDDIPTWRRYWYEVPATEVSEWLTELPSIVIRSGNGGDTVTPKGARQIRIRLYANPFDYSSEQIDPTAYCSEQIISYMPPFTSLTLDGALQRAFAERDGYPVAAADHLLYGTGGMPATWPELSCGISYLMSVDEPVEAPINNIAVTSLTLTQRT